MERKAETDPLGYSGFLLNIKSKDGIFGEIQVNTLQMIYAKEKKSDAIAILGEDLFNQIKKASKLSSGQGHYYYEKYRTINKGMESEVVKELIAKSKEYYSKIRSVKL